MYNEFIDYWNKDFGTIRGYIRNGEFYLAAEDIIDILGNSLDKIVIGISEKHKEVIDFYDRNDEGVLKDKREVTFLDADGVIMLIDSSRSTIKGGLKDWIIGEVYPDMRDCFTRDIEEYDGDLGYVFSLFENLAEKDRTISELSKKVDYLKEFIEDSYDGNIMIEDVFVHIENM